MYCYIPCLGTDVLAVVGSWSLCILAQGMRRSWSCILAQLGIARDASRSGRDLDWQSGSVGEVRTQAPSSSGLVWRSRMLGHPPHLIPNCKKTDLRLGYRTCQSIRIRIITFFLRNGYSEQESFLSHWRNKLCQFISDIMDILATRNETINRTTRLAGTLITFIFMVWVQAFVGKACHAQYNLHQ